MMYYRFSIIQVNAFILLRVIAKKYLTAKIFKNLHVLLTNSLKVKFS